MFKLRSPSFAVGLTLAFSAATANAHLAVFHKGMYCLNGVSGKTDYNSYDIVTPLYQLPFDQWWFHHVNRCDEFPPAPGDFLDLPAGGSFMVEVASNRAKTSLSYNSRDTSDWPDGARYPEDYNDPNCIVSPNLHAQNQSMAAGTAFAISYTSDIKQVRPDNLVVFSVRYNTPWKRIIWYDVPAAMPACPPGGCICGWGWVPNGCGQPNIYHQPFRCRVTNARSSTPLASPKPPVWCENNPDGCTKGAKQMVYWNQQSGNNIHVEGWDARGFPKSPAYNAKCGFKDGAQNDIFAGSPSSGGNTPAKPGNSKSDPGAAPPAPAPANPPSDSSNSNSGSNSNNPAPNTPAQPAQQGSTPSEAKEDTSTPAEAKEETSPSPNADGEEEVHSSHPPPSCAARRRRRSLEGRDGRRAVKFHRKSVKGGVVRGRL